MREINALNIILTKLLTTGRAFSVPVSQVFVDTFLTKQMETSGDGAIFESILTHGASEHGQCHVQHGRIIAT